MVQVFDPTPAQGQAGQLGRALGMGLGSVGENIANNRMMQRQQAQQLAMQEHQSGILSKILSGNANQEDYSQLDQPTLMKLMELQNKQNQMAQQERAQQQRIELEEKKLSQKAESEKQKETTKVQEKVVPLQEALLRLQRMKDIGKGGNLGRGSSVKGFFGGQTAKDKAEYEQLGKSLISLATNIPIRNRIEFEVLAEKLYDSSLPDKEREGILNAMESIVNSSLKQYVGPKNFETIGQDSNAPKEKPSLDSFYKN